MPDEQERKCCDSKVLLQWISPLLLHLGLPQWLNGKESTCNSGDMGSIPGSGRSSGGGRILWTKKPGGLWSIGSQRVGHD